jgi:hypothetical protein
VTNIVHPAGKRKGKLGQSDTFYGTVKIRHHGYTRLSLKFPTFTLICLKCSTRRAESAREKKGNGEGIAVGSGQWQWQWLWAVAVGSGCGQWQSAVAVGSRQWQWVGRSGRQWVGRSGRQWQSAVAVGGTKQSAVAVAVGRMWDETGGKGDILKSFVTLATGIRV